VFDAHRLVPIDPHPADRVPSAASDRQVDQPGEGNQSEAVEDGLVVELDLKEDLVG
jgi:hypothetical protein